MRCKRKKREVVVRGDMVSRQERRRQRRYVAAPRTAPVPSLRHGFMRSCRDVTDLISLTERSRFGAEYTHLQDQRPLPNTHWRVSTSAVGFVPRQPTEISSSHHCYSPGSTTDVSLLEVYLKDLLKCTRCRNFRFTLLDSYYAVFYRPEANR